MFKKVPKKTLSNLDTKLTKLGLSIPQFPPITQILTILKVEVLGRTPPPPLWDIFRFFRLFKSSLTSNGIKVLNMKMEHPNNLQRVQVLPS